MNYLLSLYKIKNMTPLEKLHKDFMSLSDTDKQAFLEGIGLGEAIGKAWPERASRWREPCTTPMRKVRFTATSSLGTCSSTIGASCGWRTSA